MIRGGNWKYIFMANGGREQLFNVHTDPAELNNRLGESVVLAELRQLAAAACTVPGTRSAVQADGQLRSFFYQPFPRKRIYQFDTSRGVRRFPATPAEGLHAYRAASKCR